METRSEKQMELETMAHLEVILKFDNVLDRYKYCEKHGTKTEQFGMINYTFPDGSQYGVCWEGQIIQEDLERWENKEPPTL